MILRTSFALLLFFTVYPKIGSAQNDAKLDIDYIISLLQNQSSCSDGLFDKVVICDDNQENKIVAYYQKENRKLLCVSYNFNYNDSLFEKKTYKYNYFNNTLYEEISYYNPYTIDGNENSTQFDQIEYQYENGKLKKIKFSNGELIREMIVYYNNCKVEKIEISENGIKLKSLNFKYEQTTK